MNLEIHKLIDMYIYEHGQEPNMVLVPCKYLAYLYSDMTSLRITHIWSQPDSSSIKHINLDVIPCENIEKPIVIKRSF